MDEKIYKSLSDASQNIMRDNVESLALVYITSDGFVHSAYDKKEDANSFELIGVLEMLKTRMIHGYSNIPEIGDNE